MSALYSICASLNRVLIRPISFVVIRKPASKACQSIPAVDIDASGVFKYILIKALGTAASKTLVRGYGRCEYHGAALNAMGNINPLNMSLLFGNIGSNCISLSAPARAMMN